MTHTQKITIALTIALAAISACIVLLQSRPAELQARPEHVEAPEPAAPGRAIQPAEEVKPTIWTVKPQAIPVPITEVQKKLLSVGVRQGERRKYPVDDRYDLTEDATVADYDFMIAILSNQDKEYLWGHAIQALGFMGTEKAAEDLIAMLPEDKPSYYYREGCILHALGFAAHTNDRAYEFLKQGCDPEFWKKRMKNWKLDHSEEIELRGVLVKTIHALAMSGRGDARQSIHTLAVELDSGKLIGYPVDKGDYSNPILTALTMLDLIEQHGYEAFKHEKYPISLEAVQQWNKANPQWEAWKYGGPLPPLEKPLPAPAPLPEPAAP